jgi:hypothetical protein
MPRLVNHGILLVCVAAVWWCSSASAQQPGKDRDKNRAQAKKQVSPAQEVSNRFDEMAPKIGETLPNVRGYDSKGREFNLQSLKGNYTVIVFGCLT